MRFKNKRTKRKEKIKVGNFFTYLSPEEKSKYKDKNRPDGCEECQEYPCYSSDYCQTWFCHNCRLNIWRNDG